MSGGALKPECLICWPGPIWDKDRAQKLVWEAGR